MHRSSFQYLLYLNLTSVQPSPLAASLGLGIQLRPSAPSVTGSVPQAHCLCRFPPQKTIRKVMK